MSSGGSRQGAGRKAPDGARVNLCARVSPATMDKLRALQGDQGLGQTIDRIVADV